MALSGTLQTLSLAEIFQTLARTAATGVLRLDAVENAADVIFDDGRIIQVFDRTSDGVEVLVRRLIARGILLSAEAARESSLMVIDGHPALAGLVPHERLAEEAVQQAVHDLTADQVHDLFTWENANFLFMEIGQAEDVEQILSASREHSCELRVDNVLMEGARRLDEWGRIRSKVPGNDIILAPAAGTQTRLDELACEYPANAIVPLIDGVRSVEELVEASVSTRLDVYSLLVQLIDEQLVIALDVAQICAHAASYTEAGDHSRASSLYRRAVAIDPGNSTVCRALAESLEYLGDAPEAAGCYRQLALGQSAEGAHEEALAAARRAVALAGADSLRERETLIRCLLAAGLAAEARHERLELADFQLRAGHWHLATDLLHGVLEQHPGDIDARHLLARAIRHNDEYQCSEDEVLCIECGCPNPRGTVHCSACNALLEIQCAWCTREVVISDEVCLYCGHDPHVGRESDHDSHIFEAITAGGEDDFKAKVQRAATAKEQKRYDQALAIWKEIASLRPDSRHIKQHIRELEVLVHHHAVESLIERGNKAQTKRRYWTAVRCYRGALSSLVEDDPRRPRLGKMLAAAQARHRRNSMIYGLALGVLVVALGLILFQRWQQRQFEIQALQQVEQARLLAQSGGAASYERLLDLREQLVATAAPYGDAVNDAWMPINDIVAQAMPHLADEELERIRSHLTAHKAAAAERALEQFITIFGASYRSAVVGDLRTQIEQLRQSLTREQQQLARDPERLTQARQDEQNGALAQALALAQELRQSPSPTVAEEARALAARLAERQRQWQDTLARLRAAASSDYVAALSAGRELGAQAQSWGDDLVVQELLLAVEQRQSAADVAFAALARDDRAALEAFVKRFPGSRHASEVQGLIAGLSRDQARWQELFGHYQAARESQQWAAMHARAQALHSRFPERRAEVPLPLVVEPTAPAATIHFNDTSQPAPAVFLVVPDSRQQLRITAPDAEPLSVSVAELLKDWRWRPVLERQVLWRQREVQAVDRLLNVDDRVLALSAKGMACYGAGGRLLWRKGFANLGLSAQPLWYRTTLLGADGQVLTVPEDGVLLRIEADGHESLHLTTAESIVDRPLRYRNELFGPEERVAVVGSRLQLAIDGRFQPADLPGSFVAGPCLFTDDFSVLLLAATADGRLVAYDETNRQLAWALDLGAAQVDHLALLRNGRYQAVLDGSRLVHLAVDADSARILWEQPLPGSLLAAPQILAGASVVACPKGLFAFDASGDQRLLYAQADGDLSVGLVHGEFFILGDQQRRLRCLRGDTLVWQRSLDHVPQSLAIAQTNVVVGLRDGTLQALSLP